MHSTPLDRPLAVTLPLTLPLTLLLMACARGNSPGDPATSGSGANATRAGVMGAAPTDTWPQHSMERPRPPAVSTAGAVPIAPPADAVVLFDGKSLDR